MALVCDAFRSGEVSRAMRNRGIELCMLPDPHLKSPQAPCGLQQPLGAAAHLPVPTSQAQGPASELVVRELESVLAADGVPGWQAPACLGGAHFSLVQRAKNSHRWVSAGCLMPSLPASGPVTRIPAVGSGLNPAPMAGKCMN